MKIRRNGGFSFLEVATSSFLVLVLVILSINVCLLVFGCQINDTAARDAARAASLAPDATKAWNLATASVKSHKTDGTFIGAITLMPGAAFQYQDFGGSPPAGQCPFVKVTTKTRVTLPTPIYFFGASFTNVFDFSQTYTSPIVKTKYLLP